jgi:hypothetical protein
MATVIVAAMATVIVAAMATVIVGAIRLLSNTTVSYSRDMMAALMASVAVAPATGEYHYQTESIEITV